MMDADSFTKQMLWLSETGGWGASLLVFMNKHQQWYGRGDPTVSDSGDPTTD